MTDKNLNTNDQQTTQDLDVIIKDGLQQFDIDAAPAAPDDAPSSPAPAVEKKTEEPEPDPNKKKYRFKSQDEAENGYTHVQGEKTRLELKVKELEKELGKKQEVENQQATDKAMQDFEALAAFRRAKLLADIKELDPDNPQYENNVAKLQAKADADILTQSQKVFVQPAPPPPAATKPTPGSTASPAPSDTETNESKVVKYTESVITKPEIGLAPDDKYFWFCASQAPKEDDKGNPLTLDQQIQWAVDQTKQYHSQINPQIDPQKKIDDAAAAAHEIQNQELPLGRAATSAPIPGAAENKQISLSDAIDSANNLRRL